jgi:uncharacterized protein YdcH (DUF465 family)
MHVEHHDLHTEFPEMNDAITVLKKSNPLFARLYSTYHRLTGKVEDLEEHDLPIADYTFEELKKHRVKIKDDLYHLMLAYRSGQQAAK